MAKKKTDIHKGGRPRLYDDDFYKSIVKEYDSYTIAQIAQNHKCSRDTVNRWLRKGRELNGKRKTKSK